MRSVHVAETQAHAAKLGIWSDAMNAEREAEGYP
jgi:endonuclease YncB( thermonuclease family)